MCEGQRGTPILLPCRSTPAMPRESRSMPLEPLLGRRAKILRSKMPFSFPPESAFTFTGKLSQRLFEQLHGLFNTQR